MSDVTQFEALKTFQWSRPGAANPRMASPINDLVTTLTFTNPPLDENDAVVTTSFLMGIKDKNGYTESVLVPNGALNYDAQTANFTVGAILTGGTSAATAVIVLDVDSGTTGTLTLAFIDGTFSDGETITDASGGSADVDGTLTNAMSADGLTATGVIRGIRLSGLDATTSGTNLAVDHDQDDPVFNQISAINFTMMENALKGAIDSGGANWKLGRNRDEDITVTATNGDTNEPFWRYDSTTSQWLFSNDGISTTPFGTGAGVTGGDGITVTAGDIDIDLTDTVIFVQTSSGAPDSGKVARLDTSGKFDGGFIQLDIAGDGSDGALNVTSNQTLATGLKQFTSINIDAGFTLTLTGDDEAAIWLCSGNTTINGAIDGRTLVTTPFSRAIDTAFITAVSGTARTTVTDSTGGATQTTGAGGDGGAGGTSTGAGAGAGGAGGTGASGAGAAGDDGNNTTLGAGGGGGGASSGANAGTSGSSSVDLDGADGGAGGTGTGTGGNGGSGGGGLTTGDGGDGAAGGQGNTSLLGGAGGNGGNSGATGGTGGSGGVGGLGGTPAAGGAAGDGGDGFTTGGVGGVGGTGSGTTTAAAGGAGGDGGDALQGTGGVGGNGGNTGNNTASAATGGAGGDGGNGRTGGTGGTGGTGTALGNGGDAGDGGDGSAGSVPLIILVEGDLTFGAASVVNAQAGNGGNGGTGGQGGTQNNGNSGDGGDGGGGGDGGDGADVIMVCRGTFTDSGVSVNNEGGVAGNAGLSGLGGNGSGTGQAGRTGRMGNVGEKGRDGNKVAAKLILI